MQASLGASPHGLSPRIEWLRNYFFEGVQRQWNNEFTCRTTGTPWDMLYDKREAISKGARDSSIGALR